MIRWSISARRARTSAMAPARRCVPRTRNRGLPVALTDSRRDRAGSVRSVAIWACGMWLSSDRSASSGSIARWMVRSGTASVTWLLGGLLRLALVRLCFPASKPASAVLTRLDVPAWWVERMDDPPAPGPAKP
jgi:hypothetical protein